MGNLNCTGVRREVRTSHPESRREREDPKPAEPLTQLEDHQHDHDDQMSNQESCHKANPISADPIITPEDMASNKSSSQKWREEGNNNYKKAFAAGLSPVIKKSRIQEALRCYDNALKEADGEPEAVASAAKNYAKAAWLMASIIEQHDQDLKQFVFYYKESIRHFSKAAQFGQRCKSLTWIQDLTTSFRTCLDDAIKACSGATYRTRLSCIESYAQLMWDETYVGDCFKEMAVVLFHQAVTALEKGDYKLSLYALKECYCPIEETKRYGKDRPDLTEEANMLERDVHMHTASAESLQAIVTGDQLLEDILLNQEELNMDMVYTVMDLYRNAIVLTREIEVEREAMANSRLGKLYDQVLKIRYRAKEYFHQTMQLAHSLTPRVFTSEPWFKVAVDTLKKYQDESLQHQEELQKKERQKILEELKDELKTLTDAKTKFSGDDGGLLLHIYKSFPPKNEAHKPPPQEEIKKMSQKELKKVFQKAVLHYHPDKQDKEKYGQKWKVLCDEITKTLTNVYERYKIPDD